ncbi:MAG: hypothetical protein US83_C0008G0052 [Candidatus Falkowbacteria bacterium GW2011_GWC2_38_22]|uniref:HEPN domain-containing protein n=1 Tax=Candidatus Falkowbacteria bacterium GW2011_GWE1_38_31 TaxID=1618638 RepID=A0A0G0K3G0_9BACT|nr:MAG: hypothetical protein US73_C0006G0049 [Candidatus Falkowbacteria bacterium GW2011_GWF2_38_1205]KKQ61211.1 MAG: hypothetical protein US83_C0008G0052 [Candidatus Falkowbacteria bacterium GW2011_GWC2_38_22]KKQ63283.1 MAG: hypothetical protein US84_C0007G0025 [Candidatus Falkowbacteria bacterium GW2011_GWF1_38_22]KKQ65599.1 MAG: hypothetical protein US87_C0006G0049 [Candidatus Falkowbacteria bacterium GW2011_GWE2_38_254]KKQ70015.1 MAG: hypothetical protein US91_C0007G0025 [Candidatus Falkowb
MNLKTLLDNLEKEGKIKKQITGKEFLNGLLYSAKANFLAAEFNLEHGFPDTAFKSAYDGILQVSRVIIFVNGYRPDDGEQHKTTLLVAGAYLGDGFNDLIGKLDRYRIKRNKAVYQPIDFISKNEVIGILESAHEYWCIAKKYLKEKNGQLELFDF